MRTLEGLYILIKAKVARRKVCRLAARDRDAEPRDSQTAAFEAEQLTREIADLHTTIQEDEKFVTDIEHLITALSKSPRKTVHRTHAICDLDIAAMRLRRELGDKPADSVSAE